MATKIYQPELGSDVQQGIASLGSLFTPPSPQALAAQSTIAKTQADTAAQTAARSNIAAGNGTAADYATLGVSDPAVQAGIGALFRTYQQHPDAPITSYDAGNYILRGDPSKTFVGQQAAPLSADQSRVLPPALATAMEVPILQHGVVSLGDSKMLPGAGVQPIAQDPSGSDDPDKTPKYGVVSEDQFGNKQYGYPQKYDPSNPSPQMGPNASSPLLAAITKPSATPGVAPSAAPPSSGAPVTSPSSASSNPLLSLLQSGTTPSTPFSPASSAAPSAAASAQPAPASTSSAAPAASGQPASSQPNVTDMHGEDFLSQLDPSVAGQVRSIIQGHTPYPTGMLLRTPYGQKLATFVTQADPSYEAGNAAARNLTRNQFSSNMPNSPGGAIASLGTMIGHLGDLSDASEALGGGSFKALNQLTNAARDQYSGTPGATALTQYNNALNAYAQERGKFYSGMGGTESERQLDRAILDPSLPLDQRRAAMETQVQLFQSKVAELQNRWHTTMGPMNGDYPILAPQSQATIARIGQRAGNVPGLVQPGGAPSAAAAAPPTQQSSVVSGPGGSSQAAAANASGPNPTPQAAAAGAPNTAQMPRLTDPSQIRSLPSGTKFLTPDGRVGTAP